MAGKETFRTENLDDISRALGECTLVLSMKLHTTVVATMYGVPTICLNPVVKAKAFMHSIGRDGLVLAADDRRLLQILDEGIPDVPMDQVERLRADAIDYLKALSQRIWNDYRNISPVRRQLLPKTLSWA